MTISIGNDHAGTQYKKEVLEFLKSRNIDYINHGTNEEGSVDYPDFVHPVANDVESGKAQMGIIICGSGNGASMTANKHEGIRCALCWSGEIAKLAREHNNANIICIPSRFVREGDVEKMVDIFIHTYFEGGRHERRKEKIACA